ncbi:MAG: hypothetical protein ACFFBD_05595 [Candidatus Hodarchaeota archaeon]
MLSKKMVVLGVIFTLVFLAVSTLVITGIFDIEELYWMQEGHNNPIIVVSDSDYQNAPRDPYNIKNIKLNFDTLILNITYGGGCREHDFSLITTAVFMESNPVQVNVLLSHNANNDSCLALFTRTMAFNLSPLKEAWQEGYQKTSGTIIIHLEGLEEPIIYQF